jgi:D-alanine--poly(phosphoribitol) ligase subunit 2
MSQSGNAPNAGEMESTRERVLAILARIAESNDVREQSDLALYDLQILDSLRTVELILAFATELGVDVSPAELEREDWATPQKIVEYVERRMKG